MKTLSKFILLAGLIMLCFEGYVFFYRGIYLSVRNIGTSEIKNVRAVITGNSLKKSKLKAGEVWRVRLKPKGESGLALEFESNSGKCKASFDVYFEAGPAYHGTIEVELSPDSCEPKKWNDQVEIGF